MPPECVNIPKLPFELTWKRLPRIKPLQPNMKAKHELKRSFCLFIPPGWGRRSSSKSIAKSNKSSDSKSGSVWKVNKEVSYVWSLFNLVLLKLRVCQATVKLNGVIWWSRVFWKVFFPLFTWTPEYLSAQGQELTSNHLNHCRGVSGDIRVRLRKEGGVDVLLSWGEFQPRGTPLSTAKCAK